jgi:hypothetical protein
MSKQNTVNSRSLKETQLIFFNLIFHTVVIMLMFISLLVVLVYFIYKWSTSTYDFFENQGIPYRKPLPLFGTNINMLMKTKPFIDVLKEWYNEFENEK